MRIRPLSGSHRLLSSSARTLSRANIHRTACVDDAARLGERVTIGPYCVVGAGHHFAASQIRIYNALLPPIVDVVLGEGVELKSQAVVEGRTEIGANSTVFPFASVGQVPQDKKFKQGDFSALRCEIVSQPFV
jgi:UDP-N-acetylglucosamine acyltransferase